MPVNDSIPSDPATWDISHVDSALELALAAVGGKEGHASNLAYLASNHIQDLNKTWRGPGRSTSGALDSGDAKRIEAGYVAVPEVEGCIERRVSAVCGVEADFHVAPLEPAGAQDENGAREPSQEQARAASEDSAALGAWWGNKAYWKEQKQVFRLACTAPQACIRVFINPSALRKGVGRDGRERWYVPRMPLDKALDVIEAVAEWPAGCGVYTHPDTRRKVGIWRGKDADGVEIAEIWFVRDGKTVLRRIAGLGGEAQRDLDFDWGGLLPIVPLEVEPLLTPTVRGLQQAADSTATGLMRLLQTHCYPQRDEIGIQPSGEWKTTPPAETQNALWKVRPDGVTIYLHETERALGMGVTNSLMPAEYTREITEDGKEVVGLTSPSVTYHEPSDPAHVITGLDYWSYRVRLACRQGHITDGSTAEASGDAYEQRRSVFVSDVEEVGNNGVAPQVSGVLLVVRTIAQWIVDGEGSAARPWNADWTIDTNVVVNTGPVSSDKIRVDNESVAAGTLSLPTALQNGGTRDVPAEMERIRDSDALSISERRQKLAQGFIATGCDPVEAYKEAGWPEDRAKVLGRTDGGFTEQ